MVRHFVKYDPTVTILYIRNVFMTISAVHNVILFIYHSFNIIKCCKQKKRIALQYLSVYSIAATSIWSCFAAMVGWHKYQSEIECKYIIVLGMQLWLIGKLIFYVFLMERLFRIFQETVMKVDKSKRIMARVTFLVYAMIMLCFIALFVNANYYESLNQCNPNIPLLLWVVYGGSDLLISIIISVTFARKLLTINLRTFETEMNKTVNKNDNTEIQETQTNVNSNDATFKVVIKSTLLTFVAIFSTFLFIIVITIIGLEPLWGCLDIIINNWCVILMFAKYDKEYTKLCGKLEQFVTLRCLSCYSCHYCFKLNLKNEARNERVCSDTKRSEEERI